MQGGKTVAGFVEFFRNDVRELISAGSIPIVDTSILDAEIWGLWEALV